jgi:hypothetical protein
LPRGSSDGTGAIEKLTEAGRDIGLPSVSQDGQFVILPMFHSLDNQWFTGRAVWLLDLNTATRRLIAEWGMSRVRHARKHLIRKGFSGHLQIPKKRRRCDAPGARTPTSSSP